MHLVQKRGYVSSDVITFDVLMYNRNNFRDVYANKPKGITRKVYASEHHVEVNEKYYDYQSSKAKRFLKCLMNNTEKELQSILKKHI
ncbi:hypothetical protein [Treponema putidum]|uniref:hypothetical protein n=1 Tax=Treponema putidum TaxID=221027 RepID=UPI0021027AC7|nr:hypothetical protein [Treponema putidum]UTY30884.1 hypothetical protein E4N75_04535 [Treponema putidum]